MIEFLAYGDLAYGNTVEQVTGASTSHLVITPVVGALVILAVGALVVACLGIVLMGGAVKIGPVVIKGPKRRKSRRR